VGQIYIVLNWKIYASIADCFILPPYIRQLAGEVLSYNLKFILCPPAPFLSTVFEVLKPLPKNLALGAQDISHIEDGAATGEIAAKTVSPWASYTIVGHSEHRHNHHETNYRISEKASLALKYNLVPIICVGEEKRSGIATTFVEEQLAQSLVLLDKEALKKVIIAYEPVWAIGAQDPAPQDYAENMLKHLRKLLPAETKIMYGGSVFEDNAKDFIEVGFDGLFIGRASLKRKSLEGIINKIKDVINSRSTTQK
jgi:triosephosphate isomerase